MIMTGMAGKISMITVPVLYKYNHRSSAGRTVRGAAIDSSRGHSVTTASEGVVTNDDATLLPVPESVALAEGQQPPKNV